MKGGIRPKQSLKTAQGALIDALWTLKGRPAALAAWLGVSRQMIVNWRNKERVPLVHCRHVAKSLGVPEFGLNYDELKAFYGTAPLWWDVVKSYQFDKSVEVSILKKPAP